MILLLAALTASAAEGSLCTWDDAPWQRYGQLVAPGTDMPIASVSSHGSTAVSGELTWTWLQGARFTGTVRDSAIELRGSFDANDDWLFHTHQAIPILGGGALVVGAQVVVVGDVGGLPLVSGQGMDDWFRPYNLLGAPIPCDSLDITSPPPWAEDRERRWLSETGLAPIGEEVRFEVRKKRSLYVEPGRGVLGRFRGKAPVYAWPLEEQGKWTRIAITRWSGLVLVGWTKASRLPDDDGFGGLGALGALGEGASIPVVRCPEPLTLYAGRGHQSWEIGTVQPGVALKVLGEEAGLTRVDVVDGFVHPWGDDGFLAVSAEATGCEAGTYERSAPDLGQVFREADLPLLDAP